MQRKGRGTISSSVRWPVCCGICSSSDWKWVRSFLTESPVLLAFSWCILMALNVTFSNVWGIILKEWKGVSAKTITVLICGLVVLIFSLVFPNLF